MSQTSTISSDLIWEIVRNNNAYLVKRPHAGGVQFSRDPYNLQNKHSLKHAGFVNGKGVSVQPHGDKGVSLSTKKEGKDNKPASAVNSSNYSGGNRKVYKSIANSVGKNSYRSDLNKDAISRASAIRNSQRVKKDAPEKKLRGSKAKKAQE